VILNGLNLKLYYAITDYLMPISSQFGLKASDYEPTISGENLSE
jgi:hypothetical protein